MDIKQEYIKQAIQEFEDIQKIVNDCQNHNFNYVYNKVADKCYNRVWNNDGTLFDFETARILGTVYNEKGKKTRVDKSFMFDISEDLSGKWIDTSIDELRKVVEL